MTYLHLTPHSNIDSVNETENEVFGIRFKDSEQVFRFCFPSNKIVVSELSSNLPYTKQDITLKIDDWFIPKSASTEKLKELSILAETFSCLVSFKKEGPIYLYGAVNGLYFHIDTYVKKPHTHKISLTGFELQSAKPYYIYGNNPIAEEMLNSLIKK